MNVRPANPPGLKDKDLMGIRWRLAFALQDNGWFLRSDIVWHKPNAMPESVKDRPTRAHEYLFMLTKSEQYRYDTEAVKEPADNGHTRNRRSVWNINTCNSGSSHIASFPRRWLNPVFWPPPGRGFCAGSVFWIRHGGIGGPAARPQVCGHRTEPGLSGRGDGRPPTK